MIEYIGFFISLLALVYLFVKQNSLPRQGEGTASSYGGEEGKVEDDPLTAIMKEMERRAAADKVVEKRKEEEAALLPPPPTKSHAVKTRGSSRLLEERHLKGVSKERHLKSSFGKRKGKPKEATSKKNQERVLSAAPSHGKKSRVVDVVTRLTKRQDMIIYQEIIGKPKSLRSEVFYQ